MEENKRVLFSSVEVRSTESPSVSITKAKPKDIFNMAAYNQMIEEIESESASKEHLESKARELRALIDALDLQVTALMNEIQSKPSIGFIETELNKKADKTSVDESLATKSNRESFYDDAELTTVAGKTGRKIHLRPNGKDSLLNEVTIDDQGKVKLPGLPEGYNDISDGISKLKAEVETKANQANIDASIEQIREVDLPLKANIEDVPLLVEIEGGARTYNSATRKVIDPKFINIADTTPTQIKNVQKTKLENITLTTGKWYAFVEVGPSTVGI
ncbi:MAG: hypothetical protein ACRC5C_13590, partial [Bacilli bacterium]